MRTVGWDEVQARRLRRSSLAGRAGAEELAAVAHGLCGVQAQVQSSAELQLAARVDGLAQRDVRGALWERRVLVKTWTLRGTLHLHPAADVPLWLAARRAVERDADLALEAWRDPAGVLQPPLRHDEVSAVREIVREALDGRCLSREELGAEIVERVAPAARERLRSGFAFFLHGVCQGPPRGATVTLVRLDQWLGDWVELDEQAALREACRRFVRTYGPTGPAEFRAWLGGSSATEARALFASLGPELEAVEVEGRERFVPAGDLELGQAATGVRLLPEYDAYVMGFRERERLVPDPVREQVARHGRGRFEGAAAVPLVLLDGGGASSSR